MNFAVVTVVLMGADASQRATSADAMEGMASIATAMTPMMIFFKISSPVSCGNQL